MTNCQGDRLSCQGTNALIVAVYRSGQLPLLHEILIARSSRHMLSGWRWTELEGDELAAGDRRHRIHYRKRLRKRIQEIRVSGDGNQSLQGDHNIQQVAGAVNAGDVNGNVDIQTGGERKEVGQEINAQRRLVEIWLEVIVPKKNLVKV